MIGSWHDISYAVISKIIAEAERDGCDFDEMKRRISAAYPFGERKYWPYKVWLAEVRRQTRKFGKPDTPPPGQTSFL